MQFHPALWEVLDDLYDQEWEGYLRPLPAEDQHKDSFNWQYAAFNKDECISCPITWVAPISATIIGFQVKLENGYIFESSAFAPISLVNGDAIKLENFTIPRNVINGY